MADKNTALKPMEEVFRGANSTHKLTFSTVSSRSEDGRFVPPLRLAVVNFPADHDQMAKEFAELILDPYKSSLAGLAALDNLTGTHVGTVTYSSPDLRFDWRPPAPI